LRENYGFSRPEVSRIKDTLIRELADLCDQWRIFHAQY